MVEAFTHENQDGVQEDVVLLSDYQKLADSHAELVTHIKNLNHVISELHEQVYDSKYLDDLVDLADKETQAALNKAREVMGEAVN